jgi:hypothetical protein
MGEALKRKGWGIIDIGDIPNNRGVRTPLVAKSGPFLPFIYATPRAVSTAAGLLGPFFSGSNGISAPQLKAVG